MAAIDACEPQVIRALEKDGWVIREKPSVVFTQTHKLLADFVCLKHVDGSIQQIVVVEVKCFTKPGNDIPELYTAIGQYVIYRAAIADSEMDLPVYLAVPDKSFERLTDDSAIALAFEQLSMKFIIVNLDVEVIVSWKH